MESTQATLTTLYSELQKLGNSGEHERALDVADKILKQFPDEKEAFHCKIVSLIRTSKFKEAHGLINSKKGASEYLAFEKAYCLYRLNEPKKAYDIVVACKNPSMKLLELQAQVLYRLEKYEECYKTYRNIIKQSHDDYEDERLANLSAVVASLVATQLYSKKDVPQLDEHTYELLYNSACRLAEEGLFIEAKAKLQAAETLCRNSLEEDGLAEEDILDEIAVIRTQIAYCLQKLGQEKEAQMIYNSILKQKPKDISVIAVASNNSVVINRDQSVFDSKKKIRLCTVEPLEFKLASRQRGPIAFNQCLFALYNQQTDYCLQLCEKVMLNYPSMKEGAILIKSIVLAKDKKVNEAIKLLKKFAADNIDSQLKVKLTAVQLLLSEGDKSGACQLLESLVKLDYKPGIVSTLISLYIVRNEKNKAMTILNEAVKWHCSHDTRIDLKSFWRQSANFYLREGNPQAAVKCLQELLVLDPDDQKTIAKLVIAYVNFDHAKAAEYCDKLPPIDMDGMDISAVESISWQSNKQKKLKILPSPGGKPSAGSDSKETTKKKRKRKIRLPKNYDPSIPPDPERWLPKHERCTYKKKKDRRFRDTGIGKGTQGAAGGSSDQYDITKRTPTAGSSQQSTSQHGGQRLQQRSKIQHKRKKKGGR